MHDNIGLACMYALIDMPRREKAHCGEVNGVDLIKE